MNPSTFPPHPYKNHHSSPCMHHQHKESSQAMGEQEVDDFYFSALFDAEELFPISDEKYAYELHLQEALVSAASRARGPTVQAVKEEEVKKERGEPSEPGAAATAETGVVCKICMDSAPAEDMFENKNCPHVFCRECLGRHIGAKLRENISAVRCPEAGCEGLLEPERCQEIVPREVFERWGSALCEAAVLASDKFSYCPFRDCSALLVDDAGGTVGPSECPSCRRLFCASCKVEWHSGVGCDEFRRLGADERSREDVLLMEVASKNEWRRCSSCRFYVEKKDGCNHVTCRCGFEFCYGCGVQWGGAHACRN